MKLQPAETYTARQFRSWQKRMDWSVTHTARELCIRERQVYMYRSGESVVPPMATRLCKILETLAGLKPCAKCRVIQGLTSPPGPKKPKAR